MSLLSTPRNLLRLATRATSGKDALKGTLLSSAGSLWFLLFLLLPVVIVVVFGLATVSEKTLTVTYDAMTLENYLYALSLNSPVLFLTAWTIFVSALTALGCLAISYPVAYYLARIASDARRGLLISLIIIPFWISFVVQVYALLPWVQREGYVGLALDGVGLRGFADWLFANFGYGSANIVPPVLIWIWLPFMILPLFTSLLRIDKDLLDAAQDLGAGKWATFWHITFPLSRPGAITGSILVFITAFGSFVEPQILAGQEGRLIGNYIYLSFLELGNLPGGAAASVIVLVATVVVLYLYASYADRDAGEAGEPGAMRRLVSAARRWLSTRLPARQRPIGNTDGGIPTPGAMRGMFQRLYDGISERFGVRILQLIVLGVFLTFYVPLAQVVVFSFNASSNIITWGGFSFRWYVQAPGDTETLRALFNDRAMMTALLNSFVIGLVVTGVSLLIGTPAAMALVRYQFPSKRYLNMMLYTGLVIPSIVMGVSILVFITFLNDLYLWPYGHVWWDTGYLSIIVGHVTFSIPIVIVVLIVSLREFDRSLEEAAMNLGADEWTTFFHVTLPMIKPGLVSAALLSFTFSFDELIVTLFLKGQGVETLPVVMWSTLVKKIPSPELNAASTLILVIAIVFTLLANRVQRGGTMFRF